MARASTLSASVAIGAALCCAASAASAGPSYAIDWSTIDGGGGTSSAGAYTLSGTIGQHDASGALTGGNYALVGGFWAGVGSDPGPCTIADLAMPYAVLDLADISAFIDGFLNQQPIADLDPDGIFDLSDIGAFVGSFLAGCP